MTRRRMVTFVIVLLLFIATETILLSNEQVTITNHLYRIVSGAPTVHLDGKLLYYNGTFEASPDYFEPFRNSDEGIELYKAGGIPNEMNVPPWVYISRDDASAYRYSYP